MKPRAAVRSLALVVTASGVLALGWTGVVGAAIPATPGPTTVGPRAVGSPATPTTDTLPTGPGSSGNSSTGRGVRAARTHRFDCARAPKLLARIRTTEAAIAAGLPNLVAAEAKAAAAGHTHRLDHLKRRIARLESLSYRHRLDRMAAFVERRCMAAPAA